MRALIDGVFFETWQLFFVMSPYLLLGFTVAGVLKVLIPDKFLSKHFSGKGIWPVFKAALAGIPLPLCSCGVIPVTAHLRKLGATKGAAISFIISTPSVGVGSILATASLLGWVFTFIRLAADFVIGILAGLLVNIFVASEKIALEDNGSESIHQEVLDKSSQPSACCSHKKTYMSKLKSIFNYAYLELVEDVAKWLLLGLFIGGVISYFMPADLVSEYLGTKWISYTAMLVIGLPMYVCATGSIPMVAPLILKGMNPGAGLIFLIVGPATNTATMAFIAGKLGIRTFVIYLVSIIIGSLGFGLGMDLLWSNLGINIKDVGGMQMLPEWLYLVSSLVMALMIIKALFLRGKKF